MGMDFSSRLKHAWNAFTSLNVLFPVRGRTEQAPPLFHVGTNTAPCFTVFHDGTWRHVLDVVCDVVCSAATQTEKRFRWAFSAHCIAPPKQTHLPKMSTFYVSFDESRNATAWFSVELATSSRVANEARYRPQQKT